MNTIPQIETKIVGLLEAKDQSAVQLIFENYGKALFAVIFKVTNRKEETEEVLQDVLVKIWQKADNYSADKGRLYTWMLNIARNSAIDMVRSRQYKNTLKTDSRDNYVNLDKGVRGVVPDAIGVKDLTKKLPEDEQKVLELAYFKGYTQKEISKELNMPLGSVKTKVRYALNNLRAYLQNDGIN